MQKISLVLVDDHEVVRQGLRALLTYEWDLEIVGEAATGREAVALVKEFKPSIVIMDLAMPTLNGMEATRQILRASHKTKVLVLSSYDDREHVQEALTAGAAAYLLKQTAYADLVASIHEVHQGGAHFSPIIAAQLREMNAASGRHDGPLVLEAKLTSREVELLQSIAEGLPNKAIAMELGLSIKTIEKERGLLMKKMDLHCVADLTRLAVAQRVVETEPMHTALR